MQAAREVEDAKAKPTRRPLLARANLTSLNPITALVWAALVNGIFAACTFPTVLPSPRGTAPRA